MKAPFIIRWLMYGVAALLLLWVAFRVFLHHSNKEFIKRITGIDLPYNVQTIEEVDNGEYILIGKYILPDGRRFSASDKLKPLKSSNDISLAFTDIFLKPENRPVFNADSRFKYWADCAPGNSWWILLNDETGELWIEVRYPDWSGDAPPCEKQKAKKIFPVNT